MTPISELLVLLSDTSEVSTVSEKYYKWLFEQFNLSYLSGLIEGYVEYYVKCSGESKGKEK